MLNYTHLLLYISSTIPSPVSTAHSFSIDLNQKNKNRKFARLNFYFCTEFEKNPLPFHVYIGDDKNVCDHKFNTSALNNYINGRKFHFVMIMKFSSYCFLPVPMPHWHFQTWWENYEKNFETQQRCKSSFWTQLLHSDNIGWTLLHNPGQDFHLVSTTICRCRPSLLNLDFKSGRYLRGEKKKAPFRSLRKRRVIVQPRSRDQPLDGGVKISFFITSAFRCSNAVIQLLQLGQQ